MFIAPVNWRFRSGDRFEFNANPTGERLVEPFEVADGVVIPPGSYHWLRYRLEVGTAQKRRLYTQVTWWFGGFYDGDLDQIHLDRRVESDAARHGRVLRRAEHRPARDRAISRRRSSATGCGSTSRRTCRSPATCSTTPTAIRSASTRGCAGRSAPVADLFVVYNHNVRALLERWQLESNQLLVKLQYALRY